MLCALTDAAARVRSTAGRCFTARLYVAELAGSDLPTDFVLRISDCGLQRGEWIEDSCRGIPHSAIRLPQCLSGNPCRADKAAGWAKTNPTTKPTCCPTSMSAPRRPR